MSNNVRYIAKNEWTKALGKAFNQLQEMTILGNSSENHAQAKGLIKLVFDSMELEAAQEQMRLQEEAKKKETEEAQKKADEEKLALKIALDSQYHNGSCSEAREAESTN